MKASKPKIQLSGTVRQEDLQFKANHKAIHLFSLLVVVMVMVMVCVCVGGGVEGCGGVGVWRDILIDFRVFLKKSLRSLSLTYSMWLQTVGQLVVCGGLYV